MRFSKVTENRVNPCAGLPPFGGLTSERVGSARCRGAVHCRISSTLSASPGRQAHRLVDAVQQKSVRDESIRFDPA